MKDDKVTTSTFSDAAKGEAFTNPERHKWRMIDLENALEIELLIDANGKKVWVNVDGACAVRIGDAANIKITDDRPPRP